MRLLLTSTGLVEEKIRDFFVNRFDRLDNKTAGLVTAGRNEEEQGYINEATGELADLGITVRELNIARQENFTNADTYDIYYVCGGNTYYILSRMRETGMDKILIKATRSGKLYLGVSAGSIIAGPDIAIAATGDRNDVGLDDLSGLKLTKYIISPHYCRAEAKAVAAFRRQRPGEPVITITDNQAVFIDGQGIATIGEPGRKK